MWLLKPTPKDYLITPGILPKVAISVHFNQRDFKLKNETKNTKTQGADHNSVLEWTTKTHNNKIYTLNFS